MGKRLWRKHSYVGVEKEDPGCIWTVFRLVNYHPWHNHLNKIKLLPYDEQKSHSKSSKSKVMADEQIEFSELPEFEDDSISISSVSVKSSATSRNGSSKKKSLRARIKSLIPPYQGTKSSKVKSIQEHELQALQDEYEQPSVPTLISLLKATPKLIKAASRRADKSGSLSRAPSVKDNVPKDEYVGVLELFRVDKGLFLKIVQDSPPRKHRLVKSGSFPFSNVAHSTSFRSKSSKVEDKYNEVWPVSLNQGHELRKSKSQKVVRSSSLKESLDKYGHFIDTTNNTTNRVFKKHLSKSLKLTNEKDFMLLSDQDGRRSFRERLHLPEIENEAPRASLENFLHSITGQSEVRVVRVNSPKEVNDPPYIGIPDELDIDVKSSCFGGEEREDNDDQVEIVELTDSNFETFEGTSSVLDRPTSQGSPTMSNQPSTQFENAEYIDEGLNHAHHASQDNNDMHHYNEDLQYVKYVLDIIGFTTTDDTFEAWHSPDQPLDPALYDGIEICCPFEPKPSTTKAIMSNCDRKILFDMINEALLDVHEKSYAYYPKALSSNCYVHHKLKGRNRVVDEVWEYLNQYINWQPELDVELNFAVAHDLSRHTSGWSNLQTETELLAIDLEDWIFSELLDEIVHN